MEQPKKTETVSDPTEQLRGCLIIPVFLVEWSQSFRYQINRQSDTFGLDFVS